MKKKINNAHLFTKYTQKEVSGRCALIFANNTVCNVLRISLVRVIMRQ